MADIQIDITRCKGCGFCVLQCRHGCLKMSEDTNEGGNIYAMINGDKDKCTGCGLCFQMCPDIAISITKENKAKGTRHK